MAQRYTLPWVDSCGSVVQPSPGWTPVAQQYSPPLGGLLWLSGTALPWVDSCGSVVQPSPGGLLWLSGTAHPWVDSCGSVVQPSPGWTPVAQWYSPPLGGLLWLSGTALPWVDSCGSVVQPSPGWTPASLWVTVCTVSAGPSQKVVNSLILVLTVHHIPLYLML